MGGSPAFAKSGLNDRCATFWRSSGRPRPLGNTSPWSSHAGPVCKRRAAWAARCPRSAPTANDGSAMVRRPFAVFGSVALNPGQPVTVFCVPHRADVDSFAEDPDGG